MRFSDKRPEPKVEYIFFLEINGTRMSDNKRYKDEGKALDMLRKEAIEYLVTHPDAKFGKYGIVRFSVDVKAVKL